MDPKHWGHHAWAFIHSLCLSYNPAQRGLYLSILRKLQHLLPCPSCREHYGKHISKPQLNPGNHAGNAEILFAWSVTLHNKVNSFLKKRRVSLQEARRIHSAHNHNKSLRFLQIIVNRSIAAGGKRIKICRTFMRQVCQVYPCEICREEARRCLNVGMGNMRRWGNTFNARMTRFHQGPGHRWHEYATPGATYQNDFIHSTKSISRTFTDLSVGQEKTISVNGKTLGGSRTRITIDGQPTETFLTSSRSIITHRFKPTKARVVVGVESEGNGPFLVSSITIE